MKNILSESSSDTSVAKAGMAYRGVLARHALVSFSRREIERALAALQSLGCEGLGSRDIRFQAAVSRLQARKDLAPEAVDDILQQLLRAEYDLDEAEWERDCQRRVSLSHSTFRPPRPAVSVGSVL
jgi:DNA-directed RNA polymerase specialized sigma54-like protein